MADINLTQADADVLLAMEKHKVEDTPHTQIYVRKDDGGFVLTDGGDTIQDLRASGCDLETSKRRELLVASLFLEDSPRGLNCTTFVSHPT